MQHPVAQSTTVKMKYNEGLTISGASSTAYNTFRVMSIFDPNATGVGHQPLGHDEWANLYQRYRVIGMSYDVMFANDDASDACAVFCIVSETQSPSLSGLPEYQPSKWGIVPAGQNGTTRLTGYVNVADFEGDRGAKYDKDYSASFGANPTREIYLQVGGSNARGGAAVNLEAYVQLTYYVKLYDKADLIQS